MKVSNTAERLKQWLQMNGAKQVDILSRAEPYVRKYGISLNKNDLCQYISGKVAPGQKKLFILAKALNVSVTWLMGYDDEDLIYNRQKENTENELSDVYLSFAQKAQDEGILPEDILMAIETIKRIRGE